MAKKIGIGKIIGVILVLVAVAIALFKNSFGGNALSYDVKVTKWDNVYDGNNIHFYYMDSSDKTLAALEKTYNIRSIVSQSNNDIEKALAIVKWVSQRADSSLSSIDSNKKVSDILLSLGTSRLISQNDYNQILVEMLSSIGVYARKGEFIASDKNSSNQSKTYTVLEIWSKVHCKWVMIDGESGIYFMKDEIPQSAVDVLACEGKGLTIVNGEGNKNYLKNLKKYMNSYSILIDNNVYEEKKSNCNIMYVKDPSAIQVETAKGYIKPSLYVTKSDVFNINPTVTYVDSKSDKLPIMVLAKKDIVDDTDELVKFTIGCSQNSYMIGDYYISVNNGGYEKITSYYTVGLKKGTNTICLSLDGKTPIRTIELERKK